MESNEKLNTEMDALEVLLRQALPPTVLQRNSVCTFKHGSTATRTGFSWNRKSPIHVSSWSSTSCRCSRWVCEPAQACPIAALTALSHVVRQKHIDMQALQRYFRCLDKYVSAPGSRQKALQEWEIIMALADFSSLLPFDWELCLRYDRCFSLFCKELRESIRSTGGQLSSLGQPSDVLEVVQSMCLAGQAFPPVL